MRMQGFRDIQRAQWLKSLSIMGSVGKLLAQKARENPGKAAPSPSLGGYTSLYASSDKEILEAFSRSLEEEVARAKQMEEFGRMCREAQMRDALLGRRKRDDD